MAAIRRDLVGGRTVKELRQVARGKKTNRMQMRLTACNPAETFEPFSIVSFVPQDDLCNPIALVVFEVQGHDRRRSG
jgi:hypothetical protein